MDAVATLEILLSFAEEDTTNMDSDPDVAEIDLRDIAVALSGGQDAYGRLVKRHQDAVLEVDVAFHP